MTTFLEQAQTARDAFTARFGVEPNTLLIPPSALPAYYAWSGGENLDVLGLGVALDDANNPIHCALVDPQRRPQLSDEPGAKIALERARQVMKLGYTHEHDDQFTNWELSQAAAAYLAYAGGRPDLAFHLWPDDWDYTRQFTARKPSVADRLRAITKAGALCHAELLRVQRAASAQEPTRE